ncbi:MAG TPA: head GIN domain-containing protein [Tenuifilaceae bacterium]|nr:head GIN domain-containing protein [Tenuifilaceae bacterium]HPE18636.1 head GIN domain-containing protein [Tenuifilaceae bacterium]HPJ46082.1 head GIN domain-containing protein [Tenuifilaceae bacterium]HPQ34426.1 head GIN domain-containing protein [Tenuifilaceae bacterium]HRX67822.1 head GIN domain-containing protein [Tenuifilaceae bacterium]
MKTITAKLIAATLLGFVVLSSCGTIYSGETKTEKRDVKDFTGIELAISGDVFLSQGDNFSVTVEAEKDILHKIETVVEGGTLRIKTEKGFNISWGDAKLKVYITMPRVEKLSISGSGDIKAETPIKAETLLLSISGSGDISVPSLSVEELAAKVSGSGDINVEGSSVGKKADVSVSGSGDVSISGIEFTDAEVSIVGSGDAYIVVKDNFTARIVGSGDIRYSGNPRIDAKITGSGELKSN